MAVSAQSNTKTWFLGLDLGTDSVGWAVTDENYVIPRIKGKRAWGVRLFAEATTAEERRVFRTGRRRLERRKQRIRLLNEIFAPVVAAVDPAFFARLGDSGFKSVDKLGVNQGRKNSLFNDEGYTDKHFFRDFPTIWHLRSYLIRPDGNKQVDARHYYLAIHHILKHRGHFLFQGEFDLASGFDQPYSRLTEVAASYGIRFQDQPEQFKEATLMKGISAKKSALTALLDLASISTDGDAPEDVKERSKALVALLSGGKVDLSAIVGVDEECKYSLKQPLEDKRDEILGVLGEGNMEIVEITKQLYDFASLDEVMRGSKSLSQAMVRLHEAAGEFGWVQRADRDKAVERDKDGKLDKKKVVDRRQIKGRLGGIIPNQLHRYELEYILDTMGRDLPEISDEDLGHILSLLTFRIPYYVGPLTRADDERSHGWVVRHPGEEHTPVRPWNFEQVVDEGGSATAFIERMTNDCTYLVGEKCLPKNSMLYQEFVALNELNNLTIDGRKPDVETKKRIFQDLFVDGTGAISQRRMRVWLRTNGGDEHSALAGVDFPFKSQLSTLHDMNRIFLASAVNRPIDWAERNRTLLDEAVRLITILPSSSQRERKMLLHHLKAVFMQTDITDDEAEELAKRGYQGWGTLSEKLLDGLVTGNSIIGYMRETSDNFMQIVSQPQFKSFIDAENRAYYESHDIGGWREILAQSWASAPVKRTVTQAIRIIDELVAVHGCKPAKIFIETASGGGVKGKRTKSRKEQLTDLYEDIKKDNQEVWRELEGIDNQRLQSKAIYLYFTQEGRCAYCGRPIDLDDVDNKERYDIDHIVPRSLLKDDSFDNLVLVHREENSRKTNEQVLPPDMRQVALWKRLNQSVLISDEKLKRLMRTTPFTDEELAGFVSRQLVETRQSIKVLADVLTRQYEDDACRLVFHKAGLTTEFRRQTISRDDRLVKPEYVKVRGLNDLHHAKDAYLAVVCGNVYDSVFTSNPLSWLRDNKERFGQGEFSMARFMEFPHKDKVGQIVWNLDDLLDTVNGVMSRNDILMTVRTYSQAGGFYDQNIVAPRNAKVPIKGKDPRFAEMRQGGMSGIRGAYFALIEKPKSRGGVERRLVSVPIMHKEHPCDYILSEWGSNARVIIPRIPYRAKLLVDSFPVTLDGVTGSSLAVKNQLPLVLAEAQVAYLKRVISVGEKLASKTGYLIDPWSGIAKEQNVNLYDVFVEKLRNGYRSRPAVSSPRAWLERYRHVFIGLEIEQQVQQLVRILPLFQAQPFTSSGVDMTLLGGRKSMGNTSISSVVKLGMKWISVSPTGLFESVIDLFTVQPANRVGDV